MGKHLTEYELGKIVAYRDRKRPLSFTEIGKKLKRERTTIRKAYYRVKNRNSAKRKAGSGRPRNTTPREDRRIKFYIRKNTFPSNKEVRDTLNLNISPYRVGQRCIELGLDSYWTVSKPFISDENKRKRLKFAHDHLNWPISKWRKTLFVDESKFYYRYRQRKRVRRFRGERYSPRFVQGTVKHSPYVMIFGSLCYDGLGTIDQVRGTMDRYEYHRLLRCQAIPSYRKLIGDDGYFLQDNDPKHKSKYCMNYLDKQSFTLIDFPAQSPDLNVIENFWYHLDDVCKDRKCNSDKEVMQLLQNSSDILSIDYLHRLVDSMPRRLRAVIKAKGGPTKY